MALRSEGLAVCGAGCAGLSLAVALVNAGVREPIVVLDRRTDFPRDRTWCFWDPGGVPLAGWATHSWSAWTLRSARRSVLHRTPRAPYRHLPADVFYTRALDRLARAPNVELRLGEAVGALRGDADGVTVGTPRGDLRVRLAFDARATRQRPKPGETSFTQAFLGQELVVDRPVFDPSTATLMDFRLAQQDAVHFMYVLPFAPDRALVEDTHFLAGPAIPASRRRATIAAYVEERLGARVEVVVHEEHGALPMTSARRDALPHPRVARLGLAGGAVRPSSGYAFVRIQRQAAGLAAAVAAGRPSRGVLPDVEPRGRLAALDAVFLDALAVDPAGFGDQLVTLAARSGAEAFARFMSDAPTPSDELRIAAAAPSRAFAAAAIRRAARGLSG